MPVTREQLQFKIKPIGVARSSSAGSITGEAVMKAADVATDYFFKKAVTHAEKTGAETAAAYSNAEDILTLDPATGMPIAYEAPSGFGQYAQAAYQKVMLTRYEQMMGTQLKDKAGELANKYHMNPDGFKSAYSDYVAEVTNLEAGVSSMFAQAALQQGEAYLSDNYRRLQSNAITRARQREADAGVARAVENSGAIFSLATLGRLDDAKLFAEQGEVDSTNQLDAGLIGQDSFDLRTQDRLVQIVNGTIAFELKNATGKNLTINEVKQLHFAFDSGDFSGVKSLIKLKLPTLSDYLFSRKISEKQRDGTFKDVSYVPFLVPKPAGDAKEGEGIAGTTFTSISPNARALAEVQKFGTELTQDILFKKQVVHEQAIASARSAIANNADFSLEGRQTKVNEIYSTFGTTSATITGNLDKTAALVETMNAAFNEEDILTNADEQLKLNASVKSFEALVFGTARVLSTELNSGEKVKAAKEYFQNPTAENKAALKTAVDAKHATIAESLITNINKVDNTLVQTVFTAINAVSGTANQNDTEFEIAEQLRIYEATTVAQADMLEQSVYTDVISKLESAILEIDSANSKELSKPDLKNTVTASAIDKILSLAFASATDQRQADRLKIYAAQGLDVASTGTDKSIESLKKLLTPEQIAMIDSARGLIRTKSAFQTALNRVAGSTVTRINAENDQQQFQSKYISVVRGTSSPTDEKDQELQDQRMVYDLGLTDDHWLFVEDSGVAMNPDVAQVIGQSKTQGGSISTLPASFIRAAEAIAGGSLPSGASLEQMLIYMREMTYFTDITNNTTKRSTSFDGLSNKAQVFWRSMENLKRIEQPLGNPEATRRHMMQVASLITEGQVDNKEMAKFLINDDGVKEPTMRKYLTNKFPNISFNEELYSLLSTYSTATYIKGMYQGEDAGDVNRLIEDLYDELYTEDDFVLPANYTNGETRTMHPLHKYTSGRPAMFMGYVLKNARKPDGTAYDESEIKLIPVGQEDKVRGMSYGVMIKQSNGSYKQHHSSIQDSEGNTRQVQSYFATGEPEFRQILEQVNAEDAALFIQKAKITAQQSQVDVDQAIKTFKLVNELSSDFDIYGMEFKGITDDTVDSIFSTYEDVMEMNSDFRSNNVVDDLSAYNRWVRNNKNISYLIDTLEPQKDKNTAFYNHLLKLQEAANKIILQELN